MQRNLTNSTASKCLVDTYRKKERTKQGQETRKKEVKRSKTKANQGIIAFHQSNHFSFVSCLKEC
jgi:hypothetical protein